MISGYLKVSLEAGQEAKKVVWQPHQNPPISQLFYFTRDLVKEYQEYGERFKSSSDVAAMIYMHHDT